MGLTIRIPGMRDTYDCGYITFGRFRMELASTYNQEMGEIYEKWSKSAFPFYPKLTEA